MKNNTNDVFASFHPILNFIYFASVLGFSMFLRHPLAQAVSLAAAAAYTLQADGRKAVLFMLKFALPMLILTAIINPAFNHEGVTILLYLPSGNPLTLESVLYGLSSGIMLASVFMWFSSFNRVITSDKFMYLFGRIIPAMSLILSMTLRFIPRFKSQLHEIMLSQKGLGRDISKGSIIARTKTAVVILSALVTWALENGIETSDSMKSRGYGLKGRTSFSVYTFTGRDRTMLAWLLLCALYLIFGVLSSAFSFDYFPAVHFHELTPFTISFHAVYLLLCATPFILNIRENIRWRSLYSKM